MLATHPCPCAVDASCTSAPFVPTPNISRCSGVLGGKITASWEGPASPSRGEKQSRVGGEGVAWWPGFAVFVENTVSRKWRVDQS